MRKSVKCYVNYNKYFRCICLKNNPKCTNTSDCDIQTFFYYPYDDLKECMQERSYTRNKGALRQK